MFNSFSIFQYIKIDPKPSGVPPTINGEKLNWNHLWKHAIEKDGTKRIDMPDKDYTNGRGGWVKPLTENDILKRKAKEYREKLKKLVASCKNENNVDISSFEDFLKDDEESDDEKQTKKRRSSENEWINVSSSQKKRRKEHYSNHSMESQDPNLYSPLRRSDDDKSD